VALGPIGQVVNGRDRVGARLQGQRMGFSIRIRGVGSRTQAGHVAGSARKRCRVAGAQQHEGDEDHGLDQDTPHHVRPP
jgi:hypothetical protein